MNVTTTRGRAGVLALLAFRGDDGFQVLTLAAFLLTVAVGGGSAGDLLGFAEGGLFDFSAIHRWRMGVAGERRRTAGRFPSWSVASGMLVELWYLCEGALRRGAKPGERRMRMMEVAERLAGWLGWGRGGPVGGDVNRRRGGRFWRVGDPRTSP